MNDEKSVEPFSSVVTSRNGGQSALPYTDHMSTPWRDKEEFKERVRAWAEKLDVDVHSISMRPMSTKWASCSTNGNLNFNLELLDFERGIGEYVIVHELLHFSAPNHGKLWKMLMRAHLGEYEHLEIALRDASSSSLKRRREAT